MNVHSCRRLIAISIADDECDQMRKDYLMENYPQYRKHINKDRLTNVHFNHMCALDRSKYFGVQAFRAERERETSPSLAS